MGILNVTPDSFSDGGRFVSDEAFLSQADAMVAAGVDIIDIGGESTRPFSEPVSADDELRRILPAIRAVRSRHAVPISVDTAKAVVARAALEAGADMVNDVTALRFDPEMASVVRDHQAPLVLMHMLGTPRDMQLDPRYDDVMESLIDFFSERIAWAEKSGISRDTVVIDPGIGFGKTVEHNLSILKRLSELRVLGCPILVGHSRKAFIGKVLGIDVHERDVATAVLSGILASGCASIVRVHDVEASMQAVRLAAAVRSAP